MTRTNHGAPLPPPTRASEQNVGKSREDSAQPWGNGHENPSSAEPSVPPSTEGARCLRCDKPMDPGESSIFTVCSDCFDAPGGTFTKPAPPSPVSGEAPRSFAAVFEDVLVRDAVAPFPSEGATPEDDDILIRTPGPSQSIQGRIGVQRERAPLTFDDDSAPAPAAGEPTDSDRIVSYPLYASLEEKYEEARAALSAERAANTLPPTGNAWLDSQTLRQRWDLLRAAVNEHYGDCVPGCDSYNHNCDAGEPAAMLIRQQAALESERAARLQAEQERAKLIAANVAFADRLIALEQERDALREAGARALDDIDALNRRGMLGYSWHDCLTATATVLRAALRAPTEATNKLKEDK